MPDETGQVHGRGGAGMDVRALGEAASERGVSKSQVSSLLSLEI